MKLIYARREQEKAAFCRGGGAAEPRHNLQEAARLPAGAGATAPGGGRAEGQRGGAGSGAGRGGRRSAPGPRGGFGSGAGHGGGARKGPGGEASGGGSGNSPVKVVWECRGCHNDTSERTIASHLPAAVSGKGEDKQTVVPSPPSELGEMYRCTIPWLVCYSSFLQQLSHLEKQPIPIKGIVGI